MNHIDDCIVRIEVPLNVRLLRFSVSSPDLKVIVFELFQNFCVSIRVYGRRQALSFCETLQHLEKRVLARLVHILEVYGAKCFASL